MFHIGYFRNTIQLLQCICKSCSRVLLPDDERKQWLRRFRNPRVERVQREGMFKKVRGRCVRCGAGGTCACVGGEGRTVGLCGGGGLKLCSVFTMNALSEKRSGAGDGLGAKRCGDGNASAGFVQHIQGECMPGSCWALNRRFLLLT